MGVGFNGCLCRKLVWVGGQVHMQFQIRSGHGCNGVQCFVLCGQMSIPEKESGVNRYQ